MAWFLQVRYRMRLSSFLPALGGTTAFGADGKCELIEPPAGSKVGERVVVEGFTGKFDTQLKPKGNCCISRWHVVLAHAFAPSL